jgi:ribosome-associated translation inhibitor RaiA
LRLFTDIDPNIKRQEKIMRIQLNTDRNIDGDDRLTVVVSGIVETALARSSDQVTRVEVHLSDQNSGKKGGDDDMRCLMEARLEGQNPIAVTHDAATIAQAVDGAAAKLSRKIDSNLGKLREKRSRNGNALSAEGDPVDRP